jgi:hypothetical protein
VTRYALGGADVVGVLLEPTDVAAREGVDGVTTLEDASLGTVRRHDVVVHLPRARRVADARTGESYGVADSVRVTLREGDALVLGATDGPADVAIEGPTRARRGEHPRFPLTVSGPGPHLVRVHVTGPDGGFLPDYAKNLLLEKTGTFLFPSAWSDAPGRYRITATDVLTGSTAAAEVELE